MTEHDGFTEAYTRWGGSSSGFSPIEGVYVRQQATVSQCVVSQSFSERVYLRVI